MKTVKIAFFAACCMLLITCKESSVVKDENGVNAAKLERESKAPLLMTIDSPHALANSPGKNVALYVAEYITSGGGDEVGRTVFFNNRGNKQLAADFVPGLSIDGTDNVSYYVDNKRPSNDLDFAVTENAIGRAMNTWDGATCSNLGMTKVPFNNAISTGFVAAILGFPGSFDYTADVTHAGWMPKAFFNFLAPGGGDFILGVTFTIIFTDADGNPVDLDNNGKTDVAWREIYYNDFFAWNDGSNFDVESIALHEAGHGLSQAHFGSAFRSGGNGKLHFAPRAVMNAAYTGVQTSINGSDLGGHCSNWANWPNR